MNKAQRKQAILNYANELKKVVGTPVEPLYEVISSYTAVIHESAMDYSGSDKGLDPIVDAVNEIKKAYRSIKKLIIDELVEVGLHPACRTHATELAENIVHYINGDIAETKLKVSIKDLVNIDSFFDS